MVLLIKKYFPPPTQIIIWAFLSWWLVLRKVIFNFHMSISCYFSLNPFTFPSLYNFDYVPNIWLNHVRNRSPRTLQYLFSDNCHIIHCSITQLEEWLKHGSALIFQSHHCRSSIILLFTFSYLILFYFFFF